MECYKFSARFEGKIHRIEIGDNDKFTFDVEVKEGQIERVKEVIDAILANGVVNFHIYKEDKEWLGG